MRRIIWNIITVLAVINLVWLFVFNYKIPTLPSFSSDRKEEAETELPSDENEETEEAEQTVQNGEEEQQTETETTENTEETETAEAEEAEPADEGLTMCRINDGYNARIRSGPGTDYDIVTQMESGSLLTITGDMENGWYPVRTEDGTEGYIYSELVTIVETETAEPEEETE